MSTPTDCKGKSPFLLWTVYFIYFFCGLTQFFEGAFLPEFREIFHLGYQQQMYTMFAKNVPFALALGIGFAVRSIGYKRCLTVAMLLFSAGTFLLIPGLRSQSYGLVLLGFFLIGLGFNFQMVAGNPLLTALGPSTTSSSRLNLGNALGAFAQILAPAALSIMMPAVALSVTGRLPAMTRLFSVLAAVLFATAFVTAVGKGVPTPLDAAPAQAQRLERNRLLNGDLLFAFVTILVVLGAEASLFGFFRNYLEDPSVAGLTPPQSQRFFTVYLAAFALGRMAASWIQKRVDPAAHLLLHAGFAVVCLVGMIFARGAFAIVSVLAIGLFVSIFYPTLYALAISKAGAWTGEASGLLTMGFLGCAIIPVLQGRLADGIGLRNAYALDIIAYLCAAAYALRQLRASAPKAALAARSV